MNSQPPSAADFNRRDFIRGGSIATLMSMLGGVELKAAEAPKDAPAKSSGPKVKCGVIGLGAWGREVVGTLQRQAEAQIVSLCDTYGVMLRRAATNAPGATAVDDYRKMLEDKSVQAVFVATPTHLHKVSVEIDRRQAIAMACAQAGSGDVVIIAGRGHETVQTIAGRDIAFSDAQVARELLGAGS